MKRFFSNIKHQTSNIFYNNLKLCLLSLLLLVGYGCEEQEENITPQLSGDTLQTAQEREMLSSFSKVLSSAMQTPEVREFIKSEAVKQFDGDYDILFNMVKNKELTVTDADQRVRSLTFADALAGKHLAANQRTAGQDQLDSLIKELEIKYPLLQIAVPELPNAAAEEWETTEQLPLVAMIDPEHDEATTKTITAYDEAGNTYELDAHTPPEELVVVVGRSERIIAVRKEDVLNQKKGKANGRVASECGEEPIFEDDIFYYYDEGDCGSGGGGGSSSGGSNTICRDFGKDEYLYQIKCNDLGQYEDWFAGAPELKLEVIAQNGTNLVKTGIMEPRKRRDIDNRWWTKEAFLFTWHQPTSGEAVMYYWYEVDGGPKVKEVNPEVSFTKDGVKFSIKAKIVFGKQDDEIGYRIVLKEQCPTNNIFTIPSSIDWKAKVK